jgi:hypothetical protein
MNALLMAISLWLSASFSLPASDALPAVVFASQSEIVALRYKGLAGSPWSATAAAQSGPLEVVSVYDDATKTIYLPERWTGRTPADLSVLVHETVHHLQNLAGLKYECPQQREQLAYQAQDQWLKLFNRNLSGEFEIDELTLLVNTRCGL